MILLTTVILSPVNWRSHSVFYSIRFYSVFLVINAENAAHKSDKFRAMAVRTRHEYLKDLVTNYMTNTTVETGAKFGR